jgi:hypothetical protein
VVMLKLLLFVRRHLLEVVGVGRLQGRNSPNVSTILLRLFRAKS